MAAFILKFNFEVSNVNNLMFNLENILVLKLYKMPSNQTKCSKNASLQMGNECPAYDTEVSESEVPVMLELL